MDFTQFYKAKAVVIIGTDGRRDPGELSHHSRDLDQGQWQCWDVTFRPTGTTISQTTDLSGQAQHGNFGGNVVQTFPNLVTEKAFHVDDPRVEGRMARFCFAEEGEAGEQKLLEIWNLAQEASQAGDTSRLGAGLPAPPDVSTGAGQPGGGADAGRESARGAESRYPRGG